MRKLLNTLYVTQPEAYLTKDGESLVVSIQQKEVFRLPAINIESVVIFGYMGISPGCMRLCMERGISVAMFSPFGRFIARLQGPQHGNILLRKAQYELCGDKKRKLDVAKVILSAKLRNSRQVLQRYMRDYGEDEEMARDCLEMKRYQRRILEVNEEEEARGIEGQGARLYFRNFGKLIRVTDGFFSFTERSRRPPKDGVNALLSFSYSLLANDITAALESVGIDAYNGVLHTIRPGRASLSLDLLEELRAYMCDRFVLSIINRQQIQAKHFQVQDSESVLLSDEGRKVFLALWQQKKKEQITHPFLEEKIELGLIPYVQAQLLARYMRGQLDGYPPFIIK